MWNTVVENLILEKMRPLQGLSNMKWKSNIRMVLIIDGSSEYVAHV